MTIFDDLSRIKEIDREGMADYLINLPEQFKNIWRERAKIKAPLSYQKVKNIVLCGMGGSGISGALVKNLYFSIIKRPIEAVHQARNPGHLNSDSLVIITSYSGETSETLAFFKEAIKKKAKIFIVTGGGKLLKMAKKLKIPFYQFQKLPCPPRTGFGYLITPLLILLDELKIISLPEKEFEMTLDLLSNFNQTLVVKEKTEKNIAKYLAFQIFDHLPVIIGAEHLSAVAWRWRTQFNENAKNLAFTEEAPEIFHNTVEGIEFPWVLKGELFFLFLESNFYCSETKNSLQIFKNLLQKKNICFESVPAFGDDYLTQILSLVFLGDWTSFYLAVLNKTNPTPAKNIDFIKKNR